MTKLVPPFTWFGGKRRVASQVWRYLGDPRRYVEPFAGGLAVLLARPAQPRPTHIEVVNDLDGHLVNVWRAIRDHPDETADAADGLMAEVELWAWNRALIRARASLTTRLIDDPRWCDPRLAGWWIAGAGLWVGSGFAQRDARNTMSSRPAGWRTQTTWSRRQRIEHLRALAARVEHAHVHCGDWQRVLTPAMLNHNRPTVGIFLDPPYDPGLHDGDNYIGNTTGVSAAVRDWAVSNGHNPRYRIILAGYAGEHDMPADWYEIARSEKGGYLKAGGTNRHQERIWLSPYCSGRPPAPKPSRRRISVSPGRSS